MAAKNFSHLNGKKVKKASDLTELERHKLALNHAIKCFSHRGFMTKTSDEVTTECMDLVSGQCELVNGQIVYHQDADLSKKTYLMDNLI